MQDCSGHLEKVQKGIESYLDHQRLQYPRLFFISNDDLLAILSSKDPQNLQPHWGKCFEGINKVELDGKQNIVAMVDREGERIEFSHPVATQNCGPVDLLPKVEDAMVKTLRDVCEAAVKV